MIGIEKHVGKVVTFIAQFCQKVTQEWLLSQPDSGLNSESNESINLVEKSDFGLATWVSEASHDGETAKQHLFFTTL